MCQIQNTPLHYANRDMEIAKFLLSCKKISRDRSLRRASEAGHLAIVRYLILECGIDVNCKERDFFVSSSAFVHWPLNRCVQTEVNALHAAVSNGHLEVVRFLLDCEGVQVNVCDQVQAIALFRS